MSVTKKLIKTANVLINWFAQIRFSYFQRSRRANLIFSTLPDPSTFFTPTVKFWRLESSIQVKIWKTWLLQFLSWMLFTHIDFFHGILGGPQHFKILSRKLWNSNFIFFHFFLRLWGAPAAKHQHFKSNIEQSRISKFSFLSDPKFSFYSTIPNLW